MTSMIKHILLSIGASLALSGIVKATVVLAMAMVAVRLARRARDSRSRARA